MEPEERIIQSVTELMYRFGIKSITMDDVARHLSMSKKTLYQHFIDKNEMVMKCCNFDMQNRDCVFKEIAENAVDPVAELIQLMKYMELMFTKINPNLFYDLQKYHPAAWKIYREFKEKNMMKKVEDNIERGIKLGLYRKDLNIPVIARLRMEEVEMGFNPEIYPPDKFKVSEVQMVLFDNFIHGITTLKGHKLINKYKQINEEE
jgi:TetR/AcrR family transcriptional regulator, cholesterol catabolism regulator